jgi:hypothetical protein
VRVIVGPPPGNPDPEPNPDEQPTEEPSPDSETPVFGVVDVDVDVDSTGFSPDPQTLATYNDNLVRKVLDDDADAETWSPMDEFKLELFGATYVYTNRLDEFSLANLTTSFFVSTTHEISQLELSLAGLMWEDLDSAKRDFMMEHLQLGVPTIAASAASFLTVGYLAWIVRGGVLFTTFMSSVPAWSSFDILSVIESASGKDESIEQMVDL